MYLALKRYRILIEMSNIISAIRCCFPSESINFPWLCLIT